VTIGERNLKEGYVELKVRNEKESQKIKKEDIIGRVVSYVEEFKSV
jgi:hypothetical protein